MAIKQVARRGHTHNKLGDLTITGTLKIQDVGLTDDLSISHDGTDLNIVGTTTADINISGITDLNLTAGAGLSIFDSGNADSLRITNSGSLILFDSDTAGNHFRFNQPTTEARIYLQHSGVDAMWMRASATTTEIRSLIHGAPIQLYGEDAGGTARLCYRGDPDGDALMYWNGNERIRAVQDGARLIRPLYMSEVGAARADFAGFGQLWVKNTTPCQLWFTDDAGTDTQIV